MGLWGATGRRRRAAGGPSHVGTHTEPSHREEPKATVDQIARGCCVSCCCSHRLLPLLFLFCFSPPFTFFFFFFFLLISFSSF